MIYYDIGQILTLGTSCGLELSKTVLSVETLKELMKAQHQTHPKDASTSDVLMVC